jgi:iron-sulfur cluster repair protein YtfE (RIC family)
VTSVTIAGHEHHERIITMIDGLPALADMLDQRPRPARFEERFRSVHAFIKGTLLPHMEVVESTLYPELDRLMQNRHSMTQMRREHDDIKGLVERLGTFGDAISADALGPAGSIGLRRVLYRLYAMLKVHLAEEEEYLRVLEHNLSDDEQGQLVRGLEHAVAEPLSL